MAGRSTLQHCRIRNERWSTDSAGSISALALGALLLATACEASPPAMDVAAALTSASGGTLRLPPGRYLIAPLVLPPNTSLVCNSPGDTALVRGASVTRTDGAPLVALSSGSSLRNCTVDLDHPAFGNWISGVGPAGPTSGASLSNVAIVNAGFNGLDWDDNLGAWAHSNTQIENVTVTGSAWVGAVLKGIRDGCVRGLKVVSSGLDAIELDGDQDFALVSPYATKADPPLLIYAGPGNPNVTASTTPNPVSAARPLSFQVGAGLNYHPGQFVLAIADASPANRVAGVIDNYAGTTLVLRPTAVQGVGMFSSWKIVAESGMLIWRGVRNDNTLISNAIVTDNRHAHSDGIGIGEVGTTSSTDLRPARGTVTFDVPAGLAYVGGQQLSAFSRSAPTADYMRGRVLSYGGGRLTADIADASGSGDRADWIINSEPGPELISNAKVTMAGLFGIDLASNTTLAHAVIDTPAERGLEVGLDLGGRLSGTSASNVRIENSNGEGVYFGNHVAFQSFENISLDHIQAVDGRPTRAMQFGLEVDTTNAAFASVHLDTASSDVSSAARSPFFAFGSGVDPHLEQGGQAPAPTRRPQSVSPACANAG